MNSPYHERLIEEINQLSPDLFSKIEGIPSIDPPIAFRAVAIMLGFACTMSNVSGVVAGREAFSRVPKPWFREHAHACIRSSMNLEDDWDYRRLLELLNEYDPDLLSEYVQIGLKSANPEILEAAQDFSK